MVYIMYILGMVRYKMGFWIQMFADFFYMKAHSNGAKFPNQLYII